MNEADRELLMLLGSVGIRISETVTGLFEDSLSCNEQLLFAEQLTELAVGFRERVRRTPLVFDARDTTLPHLPTGPVHTHRGRRGHWGPLPGSAPPSWLVGVMRVDDVVIIVVIVFAALALVALVVLAALGVLS